MLNFLTLSLAAGGVPMKMMAGCSSAAVANSTLTCTPHPSANVNALQDQALSQRLGKSWLDNTNFVRVVFSQAHVQSVSADNADFTPAI